MLLSVTVNHFEYRITTEFQIKFKAEDATEGKAAKMLTGRNVFYVYGQNGVF